MKCNTCGKMNCMAHGGEAEAEPLDMDMSKPDGDGDMDADDELNDMVAGELLDAIEKKDKKGILEAIQALVMNSGGSHDVG